MFRKTAEIMQSPAEIAAPTAAAEEQRAKAKYNPKTKASNAKRKAAAKSSTNESAPVRSIEEVAAFGLLDTEEGLDAFDSAAITGKGHLFLVKQAEKYRDIVLPAVHLAIVSDLGQRDLICGSPLRLMRGHRYGLIGKNGCGKTTLMRRIAKRALPGLPPLRYGYVAQELAASSNQTVLEAACQGDAEYRLLSAERTRLEHALGASAEGDSMDDAALLVEEFAEVSQRLDEVEASFGSEGLEGHARAVLLGLQFKVETLNELVSSLSGGWRMRLGLAQALLSRADCLLLDEPTNHLDLVGVLWLQNYLRKRLSEDCILLVISHDREFLDKVTTDTIEVRQRKIEQGSGNYSVWEQRKSEEKETITSKLNAAERQEKKNVEMIQRMKEQAQKKGKDADPNKQRQAKERQIKTFGKVSSSGEQMTYGRLGMSGVGGHKFRLSYAHEGVLDIHELAADKLGGDGATTKIKLPEPEQLTGILLQLNGASYKVAEPKRTILRDVSLSIRPESRIAIVGANGAGKSSLLRLLEGEQWPCNGASRHTKLKLAHVSQHHLQSLEAQLDTTPLEHLRSCIASFEAQGNATSNDATGLTSVVSEQALFAYLATFGLGSQAKQKIGTLSGGQKARLAIATRVWFRPHLLLLDEPTNHLDMESLDALAQALANFKGAAVIVSHNQNFLKSVCKELWILEGGKVCCGARGEEAFSSQFDDYRRLAVKKLKDCGR